MHSPTGCRISRLTIIAIETLLSMAMMVMMAMMVVMMMVVYTRTIRRPTRSITGGNSSCPFTHRILRGIVAVAPVVAMMMIVVVMMVVAMVAMMR